MTDWASCFSSNCFHQVILTLRYSDPVDGEADLFSRGIVEFFQEKELETYGYQFTQIFEENVLNEVIVLKRLLAEDVYAVRYGEGQALERLRSLMSNADNLSEPALANTIAVLVGVSRFRVASPLLDKLRARAPSGRGAFELGWLEFLVSNRFADGRQSAAAFNRMRLAAEDGAVPEGRLLDLCTQGVVWHLKRREIDDDAFRWCLATGTRLVRRNDKIDIGAISSWFRGLAMLPAARRDYDVTREYMEHARRTASHSVTSARTPRTLNAFKTYFESSVKEYLYVTPNFDLALEAAENLIALDPAWSPSYGECAEIYSRFEQHELAAEYYEKAAALGPPYFGHHLLMAARSRVKAGQADRASEHYAYLIGFASDDAALRTEAGSIV